MARTLTGYKSGDYERVLAALKHLGQARDLLRAARCYNSLAKVRSALKSAEGAQRHASRRAFAAMDNNSWAEEVRWRAPEAGTEQVPGSNAVSSDAEDKAWPPVLAALEAAESELERMEAATGHRCSPDVIMTIRSAAAAAKRS